ncbi:MAG: nucleotide sugar dehydrogenase [bacterium]|nr:nucleotide sugar dehydrogenase [bacterium]
MAHPATQSITHLETLLATRTAHIGVVGLGYVGLPLAVEFAKAGFRVTGVDVDAHKVARLNRGENYIQDVDSTTLRKLVKDKRLHATTAFRSARAFDAVSICVPTPLSKTGDPDISFILHARDALLPHLRPPLIFILESTTYPGSTDELIVPKLQERGFRVGQDVFVAFSPERVDPGNPTYKTHNTPKVVGGVTPQCTALAAQLYGTIIERVVPVSSCTTAEMAKLLENTFRSINIGLVNELAIMCKYLNVDVWEVINAAATKPFGFMPFYPGPGLGGHCIPIDPLYLSWKLKTLNYKARFIELADEINSSMPEHVITLIADALNARKKSINGSRILLLGVAYKRDVDDVRESPALDIYDGLRKRGAHVAYHDPYVPSLAYDNIKARSVPLTPTLLRAQDCVVIVTDHRDVDYRMVVREASLVVDTRNATKEFRSRNVVKL